MDCLLLVHTLQSSTSTTHPDGRTVGTQQVSSIDPLPLIYATPPPHSRQIFNHSYHAHFLELEVQYGLIWSH